MEKDETPLKQIRTFQGDVAEALQRQRGSLVSIQRAEHLKKEAAGQPDASAPADVSNSKMRSATLFLGSLMLLVLGTASAWYAYHEFVSRTTTPVLATLPNRFISVDAELDLKINNVSRDTLISALSEAIGNVAPGEIRHIVLKKESAEGDVALVPTGEFIERLETRIPGNLIRAFDPLFMLGTYGDSTFLVIKLASFENTFAGMLAWEPNLSRDIGPLFATAEFAKDLTPESVFTDVTDKNKDVRVLTLGEQTILLYSFFDNNMLIITDSIDTLRTVIDRLTREKLSR